MKNINLYYRAFKDYRKLTINNKICANARKYIKLANAEEDKLVSVKFRCVIDSDWVERIEYGLEYVEKAVREERQFIRTEGEVVPIEKVRKVSKASVDHLARHSNLIIHLPDKGEDIIPDQIYMVEKLSDYTVYENRFLYMLLRYLQDFISLRLEKIRNKVTTFNANLYVNKIIKLHNHNMNFKLDFSEEIFNDEYLYNEFKNLPLIDRIEIALSTVGALLQTPVMEEVSKAPMIREPITKTNVLKMNPNFKEAVALYEYVSSYKKDGYKFSEVVNEFSPFSEIIGDEYSELVNITAYLSYKYGNDFVDKLKRDYELEERKILENERLLFEEKLVKLKKRIASEGIGYEEYILTVENRNHQLNSQLVEFYSIKDKLEECIQENKMLEKLLAEKNEHIEFLNEKIDLMIEAHKTEISMIVSEYDNKLETLINDHSAEIKKLTDDYEAQLFQLHDEYEKKIEELVKSYEEKINELINSYEARISELINGYEEKIAELVKGYEEKIKEIVDFYEEKICLMDAEYKEIVANLTDKYNKLSEEFDKAKIDFNETIKLYEQKLNEVYQMCDQLKEEKLILNAKIHYLLGNDPELSKDIDFTSKILMDQLEEEYNAFKSFFRRNWKLTKKRIRHDYLKFPISENEEDGEVTNYEE